MVFFVTVVIVKIEMPTCFTMSTDTKLPHSSNATRAEIGEHTTESHSMQISTCVNHPLKISDGAFRNSSTTRTTRVGIKQIIVLVLEEPKDPVREKKDLDREPQIRRHQLPLPAPMLPSQSWCRLDLLEPRESHEPAHASLHWTQLVATTGGQQGAVMTRSWTR